MPWMTSEPIVGLWRLRVMMMTMMLTVEMSME